MKKKKKKLPPKKLGKKGSIKIGKQVERFWGLAKRLEHTRIKGKKTSK